MTVTIVICLCWFFAVITRAAVLTPQSFGVSSVLKTAVQEHIVPKNTVLHAPRALHDDDDDELASDELWNKCVCKGNNLIMGMTMLDEDLAQWLYGSTKTSVQSPWTKFSDLDDWGYKLDEIPEGPESDFGKGDDIEGHGWGIDDALQAWGLSDRVTEDDGKFDLIRAAHGDALKNQREEEGLEGGLLFDEQTWVRNGETLRVTGAEFLFAINSEEGAILAMNRLSPNHAAHQRKPPIPDNEIPELKQFSDVAWLYWAEKAKPSDISNLRYYWSLLISNRETQQLIARVLDNAGKKPERYPGHYFKYPSDELKALLGSPNGQGLGYMILQHKDHFSSHFVTAVQVFQSSSTRLQCLVFVVMPTLLSPEGPPPPAPSLRTQGQGGSVLKRGADIVTSIMRKGEKNIVQSHIWRLI